MKKILITITALALIVNLKSLICFADDFVPAVETIPNNTSTSYTLNSGDSAGDVTLTFGTSLNESLKWNSSTTQFDLSDDLSLTGGLTTSGGVNSFNNNSNFATNINTGSSTGTVSIGNSSAGAVSITSGAAFTLTGGSESTVSTTAGNVKIQPAGTGAIANVQIGEGGSGSTTPDYFALDVKSTTSDPAGGAEGYMYYNTLDNKFRCFENTAWKDCDTSGGSVSLQGAYNNGATIVTASTTPIAFTLTSGGFNVTGAGATAIGNNAGTVSIDSTSWDISTAGVASGLTGITSAGGAVSLNNNSNFAVNVGTGTSTGAISIGGGSNTVAVNSSDWDVSTTGAMTGISGITNDSTLTTSGGAVSVNNNSNFVTDINTGTSTGAISLGGGSNTVAVNSTSWDISTAGLATGLTGITSTGNVNFTGATSFRPSQSASAPGSCNVGQIYYNTATNDFWGCTTTNTWTVIPELSSLGSSGQILRSNATSIPSWSTATYPATAGTAGNILRSDGTNFVSTAVTTAQSTPAAPTGTTSTTGVMMGLAGSITPVRSGIILINISGDMTNGTTTNGAQVQIRTGTGTAPANGAALTGTAQGSAVRMINGSDSRGGTIRTPFSVNAIVTGLTAGTAVWIDTGLAAITGGTASIANLSISVNEL